MDLYLVLGIERNASPEIIRKAYRRKVFDLHPDRGGSQSAFGAVQLAFEVLSDPERRARYDATGDTTERIKDNEETRAMGLAIEAWGLAVRQAIESSIKAEHADLLGTARAALRHRLCAAAEARSIGELGLKFLTDSLKRLKGKDDFLRRATQGKLVEVQRQLEGITADEAAHRRALELLDGFQYEFTPVARQESKFTGVWTQLRSMS